ncbi:MAG: hypothetical protein EOP04_13495, partial [Proteobacteria bacterium]
MNSLLTPEEVIEELGYLKNEEYWVTSETRDESTWQLWRALEKEVAGDVGISILGSYVFRTSPQVEVGQSLLPARPAVHVLQVRDDNQAELIRKKLWNLGTAPFIIASLIELTADDMAIAYYLM